MRSRDCEFEQVAMPHARSLLRFARRLTNNLSAADDLVQESLLLAWRGFRQFKPGTNARAWLFRILINAFHSQGRKMQTALPTLELDTVIHAVSDPSFESLETLQALDALSEDQRTVLLLAVVEGFTCREIAETLNVPIGTVMSRLSRARETMRQVLVPRRMPVVEKVGR